MQKITPFLWFKDNAEEAMNFYTSIFNDGKIISIQRYPEGYTEGPLAGMEGKVLTGIFEIDGYSFMTIDGGPMFTPTPAISFFVSRDSKEEIDALWEKLSAGGKALMPLDTYPFSEYYGWIEDKYGISWQLILPSKEGDWRPRIVPSFLFVGENAGRAEEAINFYTSVFENAKSGLVAKYGPNQEPDKEGSIMYADFTLEDQWFAAMDSAHEHAFTFTPAISLYVNCETQEEVDRLWEKLSAVPEAEQCGWLADKFGVSWQIVPEALPKLLTDPDPERAKRAMNAMLQMKKIDVDELMRAVEKE